MTIGERTDKLFDLREQKRALEEQVSKINEEMDAVELELIELMEGSEITKITTDRGSASLKVELYPKVESLEELLEWAHANNRADIFQRRVSSGVFKEVYESAGEYPAGTSAYTKKKINFRKA